jgi:hypothetical protein
VIEFLKEVACHPANAHARLKALLPLFASVGWMGALHLLLRHGQTAASKVSSGLKSAFQKLRAPSKPKPTPSSPAPTPAKAAAKAAAAKLARESEEVLEKVGEVVAEATTNPE